MILEYKKGSKKFRFVKGEVNANDNIFTVIVGKNGTGKSRLLGDIIKICTDKAKNRGMLQKELGFDEQLSMELKGDRVPNKILAVSTSPFDKFPLENNYFRKEIRRNKYSYVGLRDLRHHNVSLAFMSKIIVQLLNVIATNQKQFIKIAEVLNYLGYSDEIFAHFEFRLSRDKFQNLTTLEESLYKFEAYFERNVRMNNSFFRDENNEIDIGKVKSLLAILNKRGDWRRSRYEIAISRNGISGDFNNDDFTFLVESGIVRLKEVSLKKENEERRFNINEASSGEQCIFTTFLGIACHIEDNSLICIDEPEISLHPEWQERYMTLLMSTFKNYRSCQFLIATHSPQLVSRLAADNCFILKMDNRELESARDFINQSIDFQLANVFDSPGFKNEYLNRLAFSIISKVGKTKKFDKEDLNNYRIIKSQVKNLDKKDPLLNLFVLINEIKETYA